MTRIINKHIERQFTGEAGLEGRNPQRLHAGLRRKARRMMIQSTPHGDMGST